MEDCLRARGALPSARRAAARGGRSLNCPSPGGLPRSLTLAVHFLGRRCGGPSPWSRWRGRAGGRSGRQLDRTAILDQVIKGHVQGWRPEQRSPLRRDTARSGGACEEGTALSLIHISEPTRLALI
eukprot:6475277-Alexandrium_andersonii.AAC.1